MISIVIPVRNDAEALRRSLDHLDELQGREDLEVIVAATEAGAGTVSAIHGRARLLVPGGSTRATLMNAGAAVANGEVLWFLHADSLPPRNGVALIAGAVHNERVVGGGFAQRVSEPG